LVQLASNALKHRILFLVTEDWYFASHRLAFAQQLIANGLEVAVACRVGTSAELIERAGIRVFPVPFARERVSPLTILRAAWILRRLIRMYRPNLVHLVSLRPILIGWFATLGQSRPPFVNAITGMGTLFTGSPMRLRLRLVRLAVRLFFRHTFSHATAENVFQNEEDQRAFLERGLTTAARAHLIRGAGVDSEAWTPHSEPQLPKPVVLFLSRLLRDKGLAELVQASALLHRRGVQHVLRVVGDIDPCNPSSFSIQEVQAWQAGGMVEWLGWQTNVLEQMSHANLVVLPSYREGLPKVLLEAGVAGRAVVTCDVVGCREVVRDGVNGLLVPARDPEKLADAIERLLTNPTLRSRLADEHRRRVASEFSQHVVHGQFSRLYEKLLPKANSLNGGFD